MCTRRRQHLDYCSRPAFLQRGVADLKNITYSTSPHSAFQAVALSRAPDPSLSVGNVFRPILSDRKGVGAR